MSSKNTQNNTSKPIHKEANTTKAPKATFKQTQTAK